MANVWSPSHTERWLLCPVKEAHYQAGTVGRREKWSPGTIVGTALHKGLAVLMRNDDEEAAAILATTDSIRAEWPEEGTDDWNRDEVISKAVTCLRRTYREGVSDLLTDEGRVAGVELALGPGDPRTGRYPGTADLVTEHGGSGGHYLCVTDWKTHWTDDRYVEREQVSTEESWQLFQYAYFAQQYYGLPVRYVRKCVIRVTNPKSWLYTTEVTPEKLTRWHAQATVVWDQMTNATPWQNWGSCRRYGRCEFYEECH